MPDTYAHYRFGRDVLALLPEAQQEVIRANRSLYDIGLHGPDPLFYYRPLSHHPLHEMGRRLHRMTGRQFFEAAARTCRCRGEKAADMAYLYGFLCHYALDSACHGLVIATADRGEVTHAGIESSLDRLLMIRDGLDPVRTDRAESLRLSSSERRRCAQVMAPYLPGVSEARLSRAVNSMAFYNRFLRLPSPIARGAVDRTLRLIGQYDAIHGHMVPERPDPRCEETDRQLLVLYEQAVPEAVSMITGFPACARGQVPWPDRYNYTFESAYV